MKTSKVRVTGLWEANSAVTGEFPAQRTSNTERKMISFADVIMLIPPLYPQVVTMLCQFTFGLVAVIFCGQLGKFELDAVSLANSVSLLSNFVWLLVIKFLRVSNEINAMDC